MAVCRGRRLRRRPCANGRYGGSEATEWYSAKQNKPSRSCNYVAPALLVTFGTKSNASAALITFHLHKRINYNYYSVKVYKAKIPQPYGYRNDTCDSWVEMRFFGHALRTTGGVGVRNDRVFTLVVINGRSGRGGKAVGPDGGTRSPKAYVRPYGVVFRTGCVGEAISFPLCERDRKPALPCPHHYARTR